MHKMKSSLQIIAIILLMFSISISRVSANPGADVEGSVRWIRSLGSVILSSPVISGGNICVIAEKAEQVDLYGTGNMIIFYSTWLYSIEVQTGNIAWQSLLVEGSKSDSAFVVTSGDGIYAVVNTRDEGTFVSKYGALDGAPAWLRQEIISDVTVIGAAATDDSLGLVLKDKNGAFGFHAMREDTGQRLWTLGLNGPTSPPAASGGTFCYVETGRKDPSPPHIQDPASITIRDAASGERIRSIKTTFDEPYGKPLVSGGNIYACGMWAMNRLRVECHEISGTSKEAKWSWDVWVGDESRPVAGMSAFSDGIVFTGAHGKPVLLNIADGKAKALASQVDGRVISSPMKYKSGAIFLLGGSRTVFVNGDGVVTPGTAGLAPGWAPLGGDFSVVSGGSMYVAIKGGSLVAVDLEGAA